jgi:hypothetical protein
VEEHQETTIEAAEEARPTDPPVEAETPPEAEEPQVPAEEAPAEPEAPAEAAAEEPAATDPPAETETPPAEEAPSDAQGSVPSASSEAPAAEEPGPTDPPAEAEAPPAEEASDAQGSVPSASSETPAAEAPAPPPIDTEQPRVGPKIVGIAEEKPPPIAVIKRLQDPRRPRRKRPNAAEKHRRAFFARLNELRGSRSAPKQDKPQAEEAAPPQEPQAEAPTEAEAPTVEAAEAVEAVEAAEQGWAAAVESAERKRDARFDPAERRLIAQVRTLLGVAASSGFESERRVAYQQAQRRLAELERRSGWRVPRPAAMALEHRARGMLAAAGADG